MEFARYYVDLFEMLYSSCQKIASGNYDQSDVDGLIELAKKLRNMGLLIKLAESFDTILVKNEGREFHLKQILEKIEEGKF